MKEHRRAQVLSLRLVGVGALFSGAALVVHILGGLSLGVLLLAFAALMVMSIAYIWRRASTSQRVLLARLAKVGMLSGVAATVAYDTAKFSLSQLDPSPYNPFEALRVFGMALMGATAPEVAIFSSGTAFHLLNGTMFGVAFAFLFRRHLVLTGIAWGMFLEVFQLTLYPGWLNIKLLNEFTQISALSHLVYGATLGYLCRSQLKARPDLTGGLGDGPR
jgi:Family of unknown function (DUF6789)